MKCELCGRDNPTNFHHLIPRTLHSKKWYKKNFTRFEMQRGIYLCKHECHPTIHSYLTEDMMGRQFNTKELLLEHTEIKKYIEWKRDRG